MKCCTELRDVFLIGFMLLICQHFPFLEAVFNAVVSACLGNAKES